MGVGLVTLSTAFEQWDVLARLFLTSCRWLSRGVVTWLSAALRGPR